MGATSDFRHPINDAFATFQETVREALLKEARLAVDQAVQRISADSGVEIEAVEIDLVIRHLRIGFRDSPDGQQQQSVDGAAKPRAARSPIRTALVEAFEAERELSIDDLRARLEKAGVKASDDNLHQQLRRLVQAGELKRSGRGRYTRVR